MNKKDMVFIFSIMIISILCLIIVGSGNKGSIAVISINGSEYGRYDLNSAQSIHIVNDNGIVNDLEIEDGCIYMKNATCHGRECVECGKISHDRESICCAPAGLIVTVISEVGNKYDAITK